MSAVRFEIPSARNGCALLPTTLSISSWTASKALLRFPPAHTVSRGFHRPVVVA